VEEFVGWRLIDNANGWRERPKKAMEGRPNEKCDASAPRGKQHQKTGALNDVAESLLVIDDDPLIL